MNRIDKEEKQRCELLLAELEAEKAYKIAKFNREISELSDKIHDTILHIDYLERK